MNHRCRGVRRGAGKEGRMVFRNVRGRIMESQLEVMKKFLEPLHEIVYMADMDTYELYYMNGQARRCFGLEPDEPLEGEKCYALLQGRDTPCPFCTNDKLQCGAFYEWVYYNSALQRHFAVKDTMVQQEDRRIRVELSFDMSTEAQQKNKDIKAFPEADIYVLNGRFGPYIKHAGANYKIPRGTDPASLTEEQCRTIIDSAGEKKPSPRRGTSRK